MRDGEHTRNVVENSQRNVNHYSSKSYEDDFPDLAASMSSVSKRKQRIDLDTKQHTTTETVEKRKQKIDLDSKQNTTTEETNQDFSNKIETFKPFDICFRNRRNYSPQRSQFITEHKGTHFKHQVLRPGMVLLKRYISIRDQVNFIETESILQFFN